MCVKVIADAPMVKRVDDTGHPVTKEQKGKEDPANDDEINWNADGVGRLNGLISDCDSERESQVCNWTVQFHRLAGRVTLFTAHLAGGGNSYSAR